MIEWIMSSMSMNDFSPGACRDMAQELVDQYQSDSFDRKVFFSPSVSPAVQSLAAELMTIEEQPSENWARKKQINVPRLDENATEAAASAMVYLKLARIDEQLQALLPILRNAENAGSEIGEIQKKHQQLIQLRTAVKERKFIADV